MARRRLGWLLAWSGIASLALGACSLFVSVDDLQGGADGGGSSESGSGDGSIGSDARSDGAISTDGSIGDAGVDSCVFCDDFDDRTMPQGSWDAVSGNVSISTDESMSKPNAAHFHTDALASGEFSQTYLRKTIPLPTASITVDLDLKVEQTVAGTGGFLNILGFGFSDDYAGSITAGNSSWAADFWANLPDGGHIQHTFGADGPDTSWHHFQYQITYDETNGSFRTTIDGVEMGSETNETTYVGGPPAEVTLGIGIGGNGPLPALDVYVDNVAVHH